MNYNYVSMITRLDIESNEYKVVEALKKVDGVLVASGIYVVIGEHTGDYDTWRIQTKDSSGYDDSYICFVDGLYFSCYAEHYTWAEILVPSVPYVVDNKFDFGKLRFSI